MPMHDRHPTDAAGGVAAPPPAGDTGRTVDSAPPDRPPLDPAVLRAADLVIEIASAAAGELELDGILLATLDRLRGLVSFTGASIAIVEGDELVIRAAVGPFSDEALGSRLRRGPSRSWSVVQGGRWYMSPDLHATGLHVATPGAGSAIRSWLALPLIRRSEGIGLLEIDSTEPNAFDDADIRLMETIARVLSGPVDLARRHEVERRASALREAFIGVISHELRTPITTIFGDSKVLRQRGETLPAEARAELIADIEAEADRLYRIVEDLLVLSRAERGAIDLGDEPILVHHVLRRTVAAARSRNPGHRFELSIQGTLPSVRGEETYLEQVTGNLLSNAAKYSRPGSLVHVRAAREGDEVVVRVEDEGVGIGDEDADQLFDLFYRSPNTQRAANGAGIGLFVSRNLVEAMGGRIWALPRAEGGSEFGFTLPVYQLSPEGDVAREAGSRDGGAAPS